MMKPIFVTEKREKKDLINRCLNYGKHRNYIGMLEKMGNKKYGTFGFDSYTGITFSDFFLSDEEGYFGERKVRFEDDTYTDKTERIVEVSYEEFYEILEEQTAKYISDHLIETEEVEELMEKIKERLAIMV